MKKLPQFKTLDELVAFWDKHDFADYMVEMEEVDPDEARPGYRQTREYDFTVIFWREAADGYRAYVPALPGCEAHGETLEEVTTNIRRAIKVYCEELLRRGETVPVEKEREQYIGRLGVEVG